MKTSLRIALAVAVITFAPVSSFAVTNANKNIYTASPVVAVLGHYPPASPVVAVLGHYPPATPVVAVLGHYPPASPVVAVLGHYPPATTNISSISSLDSVISLYS